MILLIYKGKQNILTNRKQGFGILRIVVYSGFVVFQFKAWCFRFALDSVIPWERYSQNL